MWKHLSVEKHLSWPLWVKGLNCSRGSLEVAGRARIGVTGWERPV